MPLELDQTRCPVELRGLGSPVASVKDRSGGKSWCGSYGEVDGSAVRGRGSVIQRGGEAGQWGTVGIVLR